MSADGEGVLGTMTVHLYMRIGNSNLSELGTAEIEVGPTLKMEVVLADMFESAASSLRRDDVRGERG